MTTTLNSAYLNKPVTVAQGAAGVVTNTTAYGLLAAGTVSTGALQNEGTGTSGQILLSGGASALGTWTAQKSIGTWQLLSTQAASVSSTIDYTGLSVSYSAYKIIINNVVPSVNGAHLNMRVSSNNGSSYDSGATDYFFAFNYQNGTNTSTPFNNNTSAITLDAQGIQTSNNNRFEVVFVNPATSLNNPGVFWTGLYFDQTGARYAYIIGEGRRNATAAINAIRFLPSSGTITSGTFNLYGILV